MKTFNRTYLVDEINYKGKTYIKDYSNDTGKPTKKNQVVVLVLSTKLKGKKDLRGNAYKPTAHVYTEVKTTLDRLVRPLNCRRGAQMGRCNVGTKPTDDTKVFDAYLPMSDGAYDKGGAYWGLGSRMRVSYTKDLSYVEYYRELIAVA